MSKTDRLVSEVLHDALFLACSNIAERDSKMDVDELMDYYINRARQKCICTQITALEPYVNPDCPVHGYMK